jgi:hypothetical protein
MRLFFGNGLDLFFGLTHSLEFLIDDMEKVDVARGRDGLEGVV